MCVHAQQVLFLLQIMESFELNPGEFRLEAGDATAEPQWIIDFTAAYFLIEQPFITILEQPFSSNIGCNYATQRGKKTFCKCIFKNSSIHFHFIIEQRILHCTWSKVFRK